MERKDLLPTSEEMGYDKDYTCSPDENNILERIKEQLGYDDISEMISEEEDIEDVDSLRDLPVVKMERILAERTPFVVIDGIVYHYDNDEYYKRVDQDDVIELYRYHVSDGLHDAKNLRAYTELYRCLKTDPELKREIDPDQETYCSLKNGIYFLGEEKLKDRDPKYLTFTCLDAFYSENADCPNFRKFIHDTTGGRKKLAKRLLMALGYLLVETRKGKVFFVAGYLPNTGKSVLFNFIQRLYPPDAVSNLPVGDLGGRFESEALLDARINISLDLPQEPLNASAVAKIKQITGGDTVQVQRKNKTSKKLNHPVKFVFATNHPVSIKSDDEAFWNRLIYLPFNNRVKKEDPDLGNKFWEERDGIVTLLLEYAKKLEELDYKFPPIKDDIRKGMVQKRPVDYLQDFIEDCCDIEDCYAFCPTRELKDRYMKYCDENMLPLCSKTQFNKYMENHGIFRDRKYVNRILTRGFMGISLLPEDDYAFDFE